LFYTSWNDLDRPYGLPIIGFSAGPEMRFSLFGLPAEMLCRDGSLLERSVQAGTDLLATTTRL